MEKYSIIVHNKTLAVSINPSRFQFSTYRGKPDSNAFIAFNTNRTSYGNIPIGDIYPNSFPYLCIPSTYRNPYLTIDDKDQAHILDDYNKSHHKIISEIGPYCIQDGKVLIKDDHPKDNILVVGTSVYGRLTIAHAEDSSLDEVLELFLLSRYKTVALLNNLNPLFFFKGVNPKSVGKRGVGVQLL